MAKAKDATRAGRLSASVRELYRVFEGYRLASHLEPDICFPDFCDDRPLRAGPLKSLPESAFQNFQWKAITTWGRVEDFKHFLPRMLELCALQPHSGALFPLSEISIFQKLAYGNWPEWPSIERDAIEAYFMALWARVLERPAECPPGDRSIKSAHSWLVEISFAHADVTPFLRQWETDLATPECEPEAMANLADAVSEASWNRLAKQQDWTYGNRRTADQVRDWIEVRSAPDRWEAAFFRWSETPYAESFSRAQEYGSLLRRVFRCEQKVRPSAGTYS